MAPGAELSDWFEPFDTMHSAFGTALQLATGCQSANPAERRSYPNPSSSRHRRRVALLLPQRFADTARRQRELFVTVNRRRLLYAGIATLGSSSACRPSGPHGFTHSVASGEPSSSSMLFWTRYVSATPTALRLEVSRNPNFDYIEQRTSGIADPARDCTARVTVPGLAPSTRYYFRFVAPDGAKSPVGRTKTLPVGDVGRFGIAIFSCANFGRGFFNAYKHAADRSDIDLALHLGDYIYEWPRGYDPSLSRAVADRFAQPDSETILLDDYRQRYASYRLDPDLQALHESMPMVVQWDDHEFANDAWAGGAKNHQPNEGSWAIRKASAIKSRLGFRLG